MTLRSNLSPIKKKKKKEEEIEEKKQALPSELHVTAICPILTFYTGPLKRVETPPLGAQHCYFYFAQGPRASHKWSTRSVCAGAQMEDCDWAHPSTHMLCLLVVLRRAVHSDTAPVFAVL